MRISTFAGLSIAIAGALVSIAVGVMTDASLSWDVLACVGWAEIGALTRTGLQNDPRRWP